MVKKSNASKCIAAYAATFEAIGLKPKGIISDDGGEFRADFENVCNDVGITWERRVPEAHVDRVDRAISRVMDDAFAALAQARLPQEFWLYAAICKVMQINARAGHDANISPHEKLIGSQPEWATLLPFGSIIAIKNNAAHKKIDGRGIVGICLGPDPIFGRGRYPYWYEG